MSIDLEWDKLDSSLSSYLVEVLNRQLANAPRPSFIGAVEVTSLDFGSASPDIELVDLRDIYRDFLEADEEEEDVERKPVKVTEGAEDDGFEWVSRRAAGGREEGLAYHHLPPHICYRRGPVDMFASTPALHSTRDVWSGGMNLPGLMDFRGAQGYASWPASHYRGPTPATPFSASSYHPLDPTDSPSIPSAAVSEKATSQDQEPPSQNEHPNLQLHLRINWHSNLRITLATSLLINYPSPMFMSLPIKLSVTGLLFTGEIAVAYEGERRRVHLCILDDLDPYGPAGYRPKHDSTSSSLPELDDDSPTSGIPSRPSKPLPVGQRLLPSIYIESEFGQADKHVLKNVTRVERFVQDVIRNTIEEELVFPNFHTLVMGDE